MRRAVNPYIAGKPVFERGFFGRRDVLDWVEQELYNPQTDALVLYGQRRIGKTSVLRQLQNTLPPAHLRAVYFDLQDQVEEPLEVLQVELADTIARQLRFRPPEARSFDDRGRFFCYDFLPMVQRHIGERTRLVLLLDEFEAVDQADGDALPAGCVGRTFHPFLRRLMESDSDVAFVFATGRGTEELSLEVKTTFKASLQKQIWVLDRASAEELIRQGEADGTLRFTDAAIDRILSLTRGHPYLTQLLCQRLWQEAESRSRGAQLPGVPEGVASALSGSVAVDVDTVDLAVPTALEAGDNALVWIWEGLDPAERIYAAALAKVSTEGRGVEFDRVIQEIALAAPRRRDRLVEQAPAELVKRRMLEETPDGHRFEVELIRRWIQQRKPLHEVVGELDRLRPEAEARIKEAERLLGKKRWSAAAALCREALEIDPKNLRAHLILGECQLMEGLTAQAVETLERAFELDPKQTRPQYVRVLVEHARRLDDGEALAICDRILELSPDEPGAVARLQEIWKSRGDAYVLKKDLGRAIDAYNKAKDRTGVQRVAELRKQRARDVQRPIRAILEVGTLASRAAADCVDLRESTIDPAYREAWQSVVLAFQLEEQVAVILKEGLQAVGEEKLGIAQMRFDDLKKVLPATTAAPAGAAGGGREVEGSAPPPREEQASGIFRDLLRSSRRYIEKVPIGRKGRENGGDDPRARVPRAAPAGDRTFVPVGQAPQQYELASQQVVKQAHALLAALQQACIQCQSREVRAVLDDQVSEEYLKKTLTILRQREAAVSRFPQALLALRHGDLAELDAVFGYLKNRPIEATGTGSWRVSGRFSQPTDDDLDATVTSLQVQVYCVAFSPNRKFMVAASDARIGYWSLENGRQLYGFENRPRLVSSLAVSSNSTFVAGGFEELRVILWSTESGNRMRVFEHRTAVLSVAFSPDGRLLAAGLKDGTIAFHDLVDGTGYTEQVATEPLTALAFAPNGGFLFAGTASGLLCLWNLAESRLKGNPWKGHEGYVKAIAFSPDGNLLASASDDRRVQLWYLYQDKRYILKGHQSTVNSVAFAADGKLLLTASADHSTRIWDTQKAACLAKIDLTSSVVGATFSPTGAWVVMACPDQKIRTWPVASMDRSAG